MGYFGFVDSSESILRVVPEFVDLPAKRVKERLKRKFKENKEVLTVQIKEDSTKASISPDAYTPPTV
ncbi:hypothetical protein NUU61_006871 [Penicillium alfredii]|uniref:Uncharacterized protein n=1 Tax=Penicillium alfredii TaxID=1506179 RepID=A0A9W9F1U4_9EURO|nr:uncharacterized protein NUU61_006871 [Penicillium alfredii]KAJ5092001.1 hypothetical protein NUU61_006871 [Penicillium alfredii]